MIPIHHLKGASLLRKDQARRMKFQEKQRLRQKAVNTPTNNTYVTSQQSKGQLESFSSKLVK